MRHARASSVRVVLSHAVGTDAEAPGVRLSIQDDGCGMDAAASTHGLGLLGSSERAAGLGGALKVQSTPGHGVQVSLWIPRPDSGTLRRPEPRFAEAQQPAGLTSARHA
ncbi:MAG: hypothetical protein QFE16_15090, partial [Pseudomonadota bacterium]|nr:hypothetical protein [Pseudomonadota bacterium]